MVIHMAKIKLYSCLIPHTKTSSPKIKELEKYEIARVIEGHFVFIIFVDIFLLFIDILIFLLFIDILILIKYNNLCYLL